MIWPTVKRSYGMQRCCCEKAEGIVWVCAIVCELVGVGARTERQCGQHVKVRGNGSEWRPTRTQDSRAWGWCCLKVLEDGLFACKIGSFLASEKQETKIMHCLYLQPPGQRAGSPA